MASPLAIAGGQMRLRDALCSKAIGSISNSSYAVSVDSGPTLNSLI